MGTLFLTRDVNRSTFPCQSLTIEGVPLEMQAGDVTGDTPIMITATVTEGTDNLLRQYLSDRQGSWGSISHGEITIGWRDGRLSSGALPERDYGDRSLTFQIQTRRDMLTELVRPMGRPAFDAVSARRNEELFIAKGAEKLRRDRLQLEAVQRDLDAHFVALAEAEAAHAAQAKATFLAHEAAGV